MSFFVWALLILAWAILILLCFVDVRRSYPAIWGLFLVTCSVGGIQYLMNSRPPLSTLEQVAKATKIGLRSPKCVDGYNISTYGFNSDKCVMPTDMVLTAEQLQQVLPLASECAKARWETSLERGPLTLGKVVAGIELCNQADQEAATRHEAQTVAEQQGRVLRESQPQ